MYISPAIMKSVWSFLKTLKLVLPYVTTIPNSWVFDKRLKISIWQRYLYSIHNSWVIKPTKESEAYMSNNREWINKMCRVHNGSVQSWRINDVFLREVYAILE